MRIIQITIALFLFSGGILFSSGCATNFTGSPHVENGRRGCEAKCKAQGMEVSGMVYMGEYTSGCICTVPGQSAARKATLMAASVGAGAGSAGVVMQMRANEQQRQNAAMH